MKYMDSRKWDGPWRIDVVAVTLPENGDAHIERFEDITAGGNFA